MVEVESGEATMIPALDALPSEEVDAASFHQSTGKTCILCKTVFANAVALEVFSRPFSPTLRTRLQTVEPHKLQLLVVAASPWRAVEAVLPDPEHPSLTVDHDRWWDRRCTLPAQPRLRERSHPPTITIREPAHQEWRTDGHRRVSAGLERSAKGALDPSASRKEP